MRKATKVKALLSTGLVLALGAGGVAVTSSTAGSAQAPAGWKQAAAMSSVTVVEPLIATSETFTLMEHDIKAKFVDVDGPGFSTGDSFLFQAILNDAADTTRVGTLWVECTLAFNVNLCEGTAMLAGRGKLVIEGAIPNSSHFTIAVTGGTGEFDNVRGQIQVINTGPVDARLNVHLLP